MCAFLAIEAVFVCVAKAVLLNLAVYVLTPVAVHVAAFVTAFVIVAFCVSTLLHFEQVLDAVQLAVPDHVYVGVP